jgi:signal transduction histidine kinase
LLDNAIKYSPEGGPVRVEVGRTAAGMARLAVTDRGLGIPPDRRQHIFERFYRAHASERISGLGLGLYITHQIVNLHGGTIRAESPPEGGARFVAELPTTPPGGSGRRPSTTAG